MTLVLEKHLSQQIGTSTGSHEDGQACLRVLKSATEFQEFRDVWSDWSDRPEADLDFFMTHLRHGRGVVRPHVMVVSRLGHPDCILVGWLQEGEVTFKVGAFNLFRSDALILRFVNGGFMGNQSWRNSRFLMREILGSLQRNEAQAVAFSQLTVGSPLHALAGREPHVLCREFFTPVETHRYLNLPASFDDFLRGLSRKTRQQFRRRARMLLTDFPGGVRFQSVRSEAEIEEFARRADEVSQKTYPRALGAGFVNNIEMREMMAAAAKKDALRACLLYVDEQPIAFASAVISNQTLCGTFTGYDPGFKRYSPGLQCLMHLIGEAFEQSESLLRFDAGCGDFPYKRKLFHSSWKEHPVWIFAPSTRGLRLHALKVVSTFLHFLAMTLLARSDLLQKLQNIWRRRVVREFQRKSLAESYK